VDFGENFGIIVSQNAHGKNASIAVIETQGKIPTLIWVTIPKCRPMIASTPTIRAQVWNSGSMRSNGPRNSANMLAPERSLMMVGCV
jgi:hypothetical protein